MTASYFGAPLKAAFQASVGSASSLGFAAGQAAAQPTYPVLSGVSTVRFSVPADFSTSFGSGGIDTPLSAQPGQQTIVAATGTWFYNGLAMDPNGRRLDGGAPTFGGIVPDAPLGALIGRFGPGAWFAVGASTVHALGAAESGNLALAMNDYSDCPSCYAADSGRLLADFSLFGSTTGAIQGVVSYPGATTSTVLVTALQDMGLGASNPTVGVTAASLTFSGAVSSYSYVLAGLPPGNILVQAALANAPAQRGAFPGDVAVQAGSTATGVNFAIFPGTGQASGTVSYAGSLNGGAVYVLALAPSNGGLVVVSSAVLAGPGAFNMSLPAPATYFFEAFRDVNGNGRADGPEPFGYLGTPGASLAGLNAALAPAFVPLQSSVGGLSIPLLDKGLLFGNISLPPGAASTLVVVAGHGRPGPSFVEERRQSFSGPFSGPVFYQLDLLRPATDYAAFAFLDANANGAFDGGESFGQSAAGLVVSSQSFPQADVVVSSAAAPAAPPAFAGQTLSTSSLQWTWQDVAGEQGFQLVSSTGGVIVNLPPGTTSYIETGLAGNQASLIRGVRAVNTNGASGATLSGAASFTLPAVPSALAASNPGATSLAVSWSANGNAAGTFFELDRGTSAAGPFFIALTTTSASVLDGGLVPSTTYFYRVAALGAGGVKSAFTSTAQGATLSPIGASLAGVASYGGRQSGNLVVQAFGSAAFGGAPLASVSIVRSSTQTAYFLGSLAPNATYFLLAFIDVAGTGRLAAGEDAGAFGSLAAPAPVFVGAGASNGINVSLVVDRTAPSFPLGLVASASGAQVQLSWSAPTRNADGSSLVDLQGYVVERGTGSAFAAITSTTPPLLTQTSFIDPAPVLNVSNGYRIRAVDFGLNASSASAPAFATPSQGGSLSGLLTSKDTAAQGLYHVRVATSADSAAVSLADVVAATQTAYTVTGLADGQYFVRGYRDVNGDGQQQAGVEPSGTNGGIAKPYPVFISGASQIAGQDIEICDRTPIGLGSRSALSAIAAAGCVAKDRGPGFFTNVFTFTVGSGAGNIAAGAQLDIRYDANPNNAGGYEPYLYLLGPDGSVVAEDEASGGFEQSRLVMTLSQPGRYRLEPTSFNAGASGPFTLSITQTGGFSGTIAGTSRYLGSRTGPVHVQLLANPTDVSPVVDQVFAGPGAYSVGGLADGVYYVKGYIDSNANGVLDFGEPSGNLGPSASSFTAVAVQGGAASVSGDFTLTDPAVGAISGSLSYPGGRTGPVRVEAAVNGDVKAFSTFPRADASAFSGSYSFPLLAPSASYVVTAYVDENGNALRDALEAHVSSSGATVVAAATTTVNLALANPGAGPTGNSSLGGTVAYGGSAQGAVVVALALDSRFDNVPYLTSIAGPGAFAFTNILGGATYFMGAFVDVNGNGQPDAIEPRGLASGFFLPLSSAATLNATLTDPPTGFISGSVFYVGSQAGNLIVQAAQCTARRSQGGVCGGADYTSSQQVIARGATTGSFAYQLPLLGSATDYFLNAFIDVNGDQRQDPGEANGEAPSSVVVSTAPFLPATAVQFAAYDPGAVGGTSSVGQISGQVAYSGVQPIDGTHPLRVRLFDNAAYQGSPVYTTAITFGASPFAYSATQLAFGTYYLDAFIDSKNSGVFDPSFNPRGVLGGGAAVSLTQSVPVASGVDGTMADPGQTTGAGSASVAGTIRNRSASASGTVRLALFDVNSASPTVPVRSSTAALAANVAYSFAGLPASKYATRAFVDLGNTFALAPGDPLGLTFSAGSSSPTLNFDLCSVQPLAQGVDVTQVLSSTDCVWADRSAARPFAKVFSFSASRGDKASLKLTGVDFAGATLELYDPSGKLLQAVNADQLLSVDATITSLSLPQTGAYYVAAQAFANGVTGAFKLRLDLTSGSAGSIAGTVAYTGNQGGQVVIGVFSAPSLASTSTVAIATLPAPGAFVVGGLATPATYYVGAFIDADFSRVLKAGEDNGSFGQPPTPVVLRSAQAATGVNFAINASTGSLADISGTLSYEGSASARLVVEAFLNSGFTGSPIARRIITASAAGPFDQAYDIQVPSGANVFLRAYLDEASNFAFDGSQEPGGFYTPDDETPGAILAPAGGSSVDGADIFLLDPGQVLGQTGVAGQGTASLSPSTAAAGGAFSATVSVVVGANGVLPGGSIGLGLPPSLGNLQTVSPSAAGYVAVSTAGPGGAQVTLTAAGAPFAQLSVTGGLLSAGSTVTFALSQLTAPCQAGSLVFTVGTNSDDTVEPSPLTAGSPSASVGAGSAQRFVFARTTPLSLVAGTTSDALLVQGVDACANVVPPAALSTASLSGVTYSFATGLYSADPSVLFSTSPSGPASASLSLPFGVSQSSQVVFALAQAAGARSLQLVSTLPAGATAYLAANVLAGAAIASVNVSTGAFNAFSAPGVPQSAVTINVGSSPANAFINFRLGDPSAAWHVLISSTPFVVGAAASPVWETFGSGQPNPGAVVWDGRTTLSIGGGAAVPSGTYFVRVETGGQKDESLQVKVVAPQLAGTVTDADTTPPVPLSGAVVQAFGASGNGQATTDALGRYVLPGLAAGSFAVNVARTDYLTLSTATTLGATGGTLDAGLHRAPVLAVVPTVPVGSQLPYDQTGNLKVHTADWSQSFYASIHLPAGTTTFDDGGQWDPALQRTVLKRRFKFSLAVGTWTVDAQFTGFAAASTTVFVGPGGLSLSLPPFVRHASVSGHVTLPGAAAANGHFADVELTPVTVPVSPAKKGAGVLGLDANASTSAVSGLAQLGGGTTVTTYTVIGVPPGTYMVNARLFGLAPVSTGPITVAEGVDLFNVDLPPFDFGGQLSGTITVVGDTSALGPLPSSTYPISVAINAWSPNAFTYGAALVFIGSSTVSSSASYLISGLSPGATYQLYADLNANSNTTFSSPGGFPKTVLVPLGGQGSLSLSFEASSGSVAGLLLLLPTSPAPDFTQATFFGKILQSGDPFKVGRTFTSRVVDLPGFLCGGNPAESSGTPTGCAPGISSATFAVNGLDTMLLQLTLLYQPTGFSSVKSVGVVNGRSTAATFDARGNTYALSGRINDQLSNPRFNTNALLVANAGFYAPAGYPVGLSSTTARVTAIQRTFDNFNDPVSTTTFDPASSRVGFITAAGTYSISGLTPGIYLVRTRNLLDAQDGSQVAPLQQQLVIVSSQDQSGIDFTLSDGFSAAGTIALDGGVQDARALLVRVFNSRQEVVYSSTTFLGNAGAGLNVNSVDYLVSRLPAGDFYTLTVRDTGLPVKYAASPIQFPDRGSSPNGLQASLTGQNVTLKRAAAVTLKLRDSSSGQLITQDNVSLLAPTFRCYAEANPFVAGGFVLAISSVAGSPVQVDGTVLIGPLVPSISYDVTCDQTAFDLGFLRRGAQNYAPVTVSGVTPGPGELRDVGTLALRQGQAVGGRVIDVTGAPLANIEVDAAPSGVSSAFTVRTFTGQDGSYSLWVSSAASRYFDLTAAPRAAGGANALYQSVTLVSFDVSRSTTANFTLTPLPAEVNGTVTTVDGQPLSYPFGDRKGFPAAAVFLQPSGVVPTVSPLGDISAVTGADGSFDVPGLSTGTYTLRAASLGYAVYEATIAVVPGTNAVGTLVLRKGATVTGRVLKPDPSSPSGFSQPSASELGGASAADDTFTEFVVGNVDQDPQTNTISGYTITGFKPNIGYSIALYPQTGDDICFPPEGQELTFSAAESTATKTVNLTCRPAPANCFATAKLLDGGQVALAFSCSQPLRNLTAPDNDVNMQDPTGLDVVSTTFNSTGAPLTSPDGTGLFLGSDKKLSTDRKTITALYRLADGEAHFSIRVQAFASTVDPATGQNFHIDQTFDFFTAVLSRTEQKINNIRGGLLKLEAAKNEEEHSEIDLDAGALDGGTTGQIDVQLSKGQDASQLSTLSLRRAVTAAEIARASKLSAFPPEMAAAMTALKQGRVGGLRAVNSAGVITPFSAFYDIFLPAGIKHELKKKSRLTLTYNASLSSSTALNNLGVWFYNPASNRYEQQDDGKVIDSVNHTVSVNVSHFSVYVVLASSPIVTSTNPFAGTEIDVRNFPNPFNLNVKTKSVNSSAGSGQFTAGQAVTFRGTMIRIGVPAGLPTDGSIRIYDMAGELVRKIDMTGLAPASIEYFTWDGRNDAGMDVANGVYVGEVKIGDKKAFWKMALIKDSRYQ